MSWCRVGEYAVFEADVAHAGSAAVFSATIPSFCPERANKLPVRLGEGGFRHPERLACFAQRSAQGPEGNDDLIRQSTIQSPYQRISAGLEQPLIFFSVPFVTTPKRAARTRTQTSAV
jgi:hypothetical protein